MQDWQFDYYCRVYGLSNFPNLFGALLTLDDRRTDPSNPSCFVNQSGIPLLSPLSLSPPLQSTLVATAIAWHYEGATLSLKSSLTIGSDGLAMGQTYQFMVIMQNRRNASARSVGYLLVRMQNVNVPTISVR